jgi:Mor family transcriptional regulator
MKEHLRQIMTVKMCGDNNPNVKIKQIEHSNIITAYLNGRKVSELAKKYNVCTVTIYNILRASKNNE